MTNTVEMPSAEIQAFDLFRGTRLLQRRWKIIVSVALAAALIGVGATFFIPPIWESEVDIQMGTLNGEPLENARSLARLVESDAIARDLPASRDQIRQPLRVQIVESTPGSGIAAVVYLRVLSRGRTPDDARTGAAQALDFVKRRHAELAQTSDRYTLQYEQTLSTAVEELGHSVSKIESLLVSPQRTSQESSFAAVLLQSQRETIRSQLIVLSRELRDLKVKRALGTKDTREIAPPSTPQRPIWPSRLVFAIVGGGLGLVSAALLVLLRS